MILSTILEAKIGINVEIICGTIELIIALIFEYYGEHKNNKPQPKHLKK